MRKKTLRSLENYEAACEEICKISASSEILLSQIVSSMDKYPDDEFLKEFHQEFVYLCENAKSVKYKLLSTGKLPRRASKRMIESVNRINLILERYNIQMQRSET